MSDREWSGSVAVLPTSVRHLAVEMVNLARTGDVAKMAEFLTDHAYTLSEWADAIEQLYARLDDKPGGRVTNAQAIALGRRITDRTASALVYPTRFDLPEGYLYVEIHDNVPNSRAFACGIAPDGSVSS